MRVISFEDLAIYRHPNGKFYKKHPCGYPANELGRQVAVDYSCNDYEQVYPTDICENRRYGISIVGRMQDQGATLKRALLILQELAGECRGYRHSFVICNYTVNVPVIVESTDPRAGFFTMAWFIRSGQFFTFLESKDPPETAVFGSDGGYTMKLHLDWSDGHRITVPAQ